MTAQPSSSTVIVERVDVSAYTVPTDFPESDGTLEWDKTTIVVVEVTAGGTRSLGYTYADTATAKLIGDRLSGIIEGRDAMDVPGSWFAMVHAIRNLGRPGIASMAIAALDNSLWDLKARLLRLPLAKLLGRVHDSIEIYGSGGFTSYSDVQVREQFEGWAAQGIASFKMKIGRNPHADPGRVRAAREAIGAQARLFVDANGAYTRKQALALAHSFSEVDVSWFEEPVSSDDLAGLRLIRNQGPPGMEIAAGEYGYDLAYFRRMLAAQAVDVLQADATRCAGISEFLRAGALCQARSMPFSAHTSPSLHIHPCCALTQTINIEYFHDHARIEQMLFDGAPEPVKGRLYPDLSRPGIGLELKRSDAEKYAAE